MIRWWWVRHGPTHRKDMIGWTDAPADLSDTDSLRRLHDFLPAGAPVISSDLSRAVDTASAIQGTRPRLPHAPELREFHFGDWEERHFHDVERSDPDHIRRFWEQPGDVAAPQGESWNALSTRVSTFVDGNSANLDIVAVAHMGVILTQVQRALGISAYEVFSHKINNLSVTQLRWDGLNWHVEHINHHP